MCFFCVFFFASKVCRICAWYKVLFVEDCSVVSDLGGRVMDYTLDEMELVTCM